MSPLPPPSPPKPPRLHDPREDKLLERHRRQAMRARGLQLLGIGLLLAGYAVLAVSPETPSEWVLVRVAAGFGLLFFGFGLAVMPWLSRVSRGEE